MRRDPDRREFIKTATAATAGTAFSYSRILGAQERVRLGLIGCGARGVEDMNNFIALGTDVVALCDVYAAQIDRAKQTAANAKTFKDHRKLLDQKDVDAVLIARARPLALADRASTRSNAGKDVYVEKPLTLTIEEGPAIVKAARRQQAHLPGRACSSVPASTTWRPSSEYMDSGKLGKVTLARTWWHGNTYPPPQGAGRPQDAARRPGLGALPRTR